jgi:hypothetical protein
MLMLAVQQQRAGNAATSKPCCARSHPADRIIVPNGIRTPVRSSANLPIRGNHNSAFLSTSSGVSHVSAAPRHIILLLRE